MNMRVFLELLIVFLNFAIKNFEKLIGNLLLHIENVIICP